MTTLSSRGAIAAGHRLTAEAGALMLREGGTAVDAAIAALAMACVCEPVLASPGGGGFAMLRDGATGAVTLLDFFPQTPKEKRQVGGIGCRDILADFGTATQRFQIGAGTVASPGFFNGIEALRRAGAKFSLSSHFKPAIDAARAGVAVTPYQHYLATIVQPILMATTSATRLFAPGGAVPTAGENVTNPGLADAFDLMARSGFSENEIGTAIVDMQAESGNLTSRDLSGYQVEQRQPLTLNLQSYAVHLNPLPAASGTIIAYALEHLGGNGSIDLAKALCVADSARRQAGGDLAQLIQQPMRQKGTTHISVVDAQDNACAVTVSNGEGNGEIVDGFGFMLNNILGEEDVNPHGCADWPVDTRLASMMCPVIIADKTGGLNILGSGGSSRIRSAVFQTVVRLCLRSETLESAVMAHRLHVENGRLDFEDLFFGDATNALCEAFPDYRAWPGRNMFFGGVHAVSRDAGGRFDGAGDPRREGVALVVS